MSINLKQILITDTDNIKLDKVNYNFDQLVSNGGGPQGPQGSVGETGPIGITGAQGIQGAQGVKGDQGIKGLDGGGHWSLVKGNLTENSTSDVLYPISGDVAPKVVLGYLNTDSAYSAENNKSVLTLHRKNDFVSNLRLLNLDSSDAFDWISDVINNETVVTAKFNTTNNNKFINFADKFIFKATGADVLNLNSDDLNINVNTTFENDITIDGNLKITSGDPVVDKSGFVAVSNDNQGTLVFKDTEVLGGSAPVGTIVSILPNIFNDNTKFINSEAYKITNANTELLKVSLGKGLGGYKGWYICNGKTWTNGDDINYTTPDLNSFSYEIEDNPDSNTLDTSQGFAKVENFESSILGGANIYMEAIWNSNSGVYNISQTTEIENDDISNGNLADPDNDPYITFDIKRFPQIIYLGDPDLYWEDAGSDWAPLTTVTHTFTDENPDHDYVNTESFEANSGTSGSFIKFINPPTDYYWDANSLPTMIPPLPVGYTIEQPIELVPADTDPGLYNERLKITVNYNEHPGSDIQINFKFDSTAHIKVIPTPRDVEFSFRDTSGTLTGQNNPYISYVNDIPDNAGESDIFEITAPDGQQWSSPPNISGPSGYSFRTSLGTDTNNNNTTLEVIVEYTSFPVSGPVEFTYDASSSLEAIPDTTITFVYSSTESDLKNAIVDNTNSNIIGQFSGTPGSSSNFSGSKLTLNSYSGFKFVWGLNNSIEPDVNGSYALSELTYDSNPAVLLDIIKGFDISNGSTINGFNVLSSMEWSFSIDTWPSQDVTIQLYVNSEATSEQPIVQFLTQNPENYPLRVTSQNGNEVRPDGTLKNIGINNAYISLQLLSASSTQERTILYDLKNNAGTVLEVSNSNNVIQDDYAEFYSMQAPIELSFNEEIIVKDDDMSLSTGMLGWRNQGAVLIYVEEIPSQYPGETDVTHIESIHIRYWVDDSQLTLNNAGVEVDVVDLSIL